MELLDALCCPVSQEPYGSAGAVRPRILPCGHTISHTSLKSVRCPETCCHISLAAREAQAGLLDAYLSVRKPVNDHVEAMCAIRCWLGLHLTAEPATFTCDLQILKQDSTQQHTCPICRTFLHSDCASTYPTNFAILDILPRILRLQHGASFTPLPDYTAPLDAVGSDSDSDAPGRSMPIGSEASTAALPTPMPSMAATAALFPQLPWLQERVDLPLRLLDLLSVAQGQGTTLPTRVAEQVAAKYKLPADAIRILQPSSTPLHTSSQTESPIRQGAVPSDPWS